MELKRKHRECVLDDREERQKERKKERYDELKKERYDELRLVGE